MDSGQKDVQDAIEQCFTCLNKGKSRKWVLEAQIKKKYHKTKVNGKEYFPKVNFVRYADDFIVTGKSKEILENGVLPIIREFLSERGLELSEEKTVITHIENGFDFDVW